MEVAVVLVNVIISLFAGIIWWWSGITLSPYVKTGKSAFVAFTWFWIFNPDWFVEEGQQTFRKERRRFVITMLIVILLLTGQMRLYD